VLLSKLTYNTEQVANATTDSITVFIRDTLTIFGLIGYLLYLNWKLTLISLVVAPLVAALIAASTRCSAATACASRTRWATSPRRQGGHRGAARGAGVQTPGLPGRRVRAGDRAQRRSHMKLMMTKA